MKWIQDETQARASVDAKGDDISSSGYALGCLEQPGTQATCGWMMRVRLCRGVEQVKGYGSVRLLGLR